MTAIERFEDLRVWQQAREVVGAVYQLTKEFPSNEKHGLAAQMQASAVYTMSNIADGFEYGTVQEFINALHMAQGSNGRVRSQVYVALDLWYILQVECDDLIKRCEKLTRRIRDLIAHLDPESHGPVRAWKIEEPES